MAEACADVLARESPTRIGTTGTDDRGGGFGLTGGTSFSGSAGVNEDDSTNIGATACLEFRAGFLDVWADDAVSESETDTNVDIRGAD